MDRSLAWAPGSASRNSLTRLPWLHPPVLNPGYGGFVGAATEGRKRYRCARSWAFGVFAALFVN
jgi:hypothetical protein